MYKCIIVLVLAICAQAHKYSAVFPEDIPSLSDSRIIDGSPAAPGQFPYQAYVRFTEPSGQKFGCGGTLISPDWVLTAAHCVTRTISAEVHLGNVRHADSPVIIKSENLIIHPNYVHSGFWNDIALIGLPTPAPLSENIQPIALSTDPRATFEGREAIVSGFGRTVTGGSDSPVLLFAPVRVISILSCRSGFPNNVRESVICTVGVDNTAQGTCHGDNGGPLVLEEDGVVKLIGVVSFGSGNCNAPTPKGYARPSHFLPWITEVTGLTFN